VPIVRDLQSFMVLAILVGGCSFTGYMSDDPPSPGDDQPPGPDAGEPPDSIAKCGTPDETDLVLCLEFEDSASDLELLDSSPARRKIATTGLSDVARMDSMAVHIGADSVTYLPQENALEMHGAYTLAAWVFPDTMPSIGAVGGIFDHENQYAMYVRGAARERMEHRCSQMNLPGEWSAELPEDAWSFIACTWDGTNNCAYRWTGETDHEKWCTPMAALTDAGAEGLAIGHLSDQGQPHSRFDGKLDSVQLYKRTLDVAQLCALVGRGADCM
jgi:hypothetical protein